MTLRVLFAFLIASALVRAASFSPDAVLTVMSYNVRFASETPPNDWPTRRPLLRECIRQAEPDVIGTQEGVYSQLNDIAEDLPQYSWIGLGRDGGSRGEFMAVWYRKERVEPLAFDHFWLSDTPEVVGSTTWGNKIRRMVTWVRFRDKTTGAEFYFWNTHFDHEVQVAREKSGELLRRRIAEIGDELPVILVGDFNAAAGENPVYASLLAGDYFLDSWTAAPERKGEGFGTFNGFGETPQGGARIDWILVRGNVEVLSSEIVTYKAGAQYASDHYPVVARLRVNAAAR